MSEPTAEELKKEIALLKMQLYGTAVDAWAAGAYWMKLWIKLHNQGVEYPVEELVQFVAGDRYVHLLSNEENNNGGIRRKEDSG